MPEWLRVYQRPREGWLALGLLFVMLLSLGWAVQRAGWLDRLEFIVPVAFYAVLLGTVLGLSRLSVAIVIPVSAMLGTFVVLWTVGGEYFPELSQGGRVMALRDEGIRWAAIVLDLGYAPQLTPYAIGLGLLMWVTSFIAAYTMYRHHRVLDAIVVSGAALIANMSATFTDLFVYLILFVLAALLLWLRAALIGREEGWQRRRVNENAEVPAAIMRSGVLFIAGSIALAWVLTTVAVAAPLTNLWNNLDGAWSDVRDGLDGVFGGFANSNARLGGTAFGESFSISGKWISDDEPVMTVASTRPYYLRSVTYDIYTGRGWDSTDGRERVVPAETPIFPGYSPERPTQTDAFELETVTIQMQNSVGRNLFSPGYPTAAFVPLVIVESADQPFLGQIKATTAIGPGEGYLITAALSRATEAQLAAAGTNYPEEIVRHYLGTSGVSDATRTLARTIVTEAGALTAYDQAKALVAYLRGTGFRYATNAPIPDDPDRDMVDFFLFDENGQVGYCEYYASAMAVMARTLGLPARVAVGFAPGDRIVLAGAGEAAGNVYQVRRRDAHAWAEIYFPGYGWQTFEATKSITPLSRPRGATQPGASGGPAPSLGARPFDEGVDAGIISTLPSFQALPGGYRPGDAGPPDETRGGNALLIVALIALALGFAAWRLLRSRRALRFLAPGERQWRRLALAADRAGVAQRPSETIYEYAGWLQDQIPRRRPEIRTIADGKVWQSYSGRGMSGGAIERIERAWKRLEVPLIWLAVKRRLRSLLPGR
ncbi:MAG TPA: transglutaminaseTgpA domain-containing protein [Candidatus Dormibacteraeota bacterium]|nr:transglutaminaseTgpA domain-containing protein [Candidatus Dormibacteraeota bacterium]